MRFWTQRRTRLIAACPLLFMVAAFAETPEQDFAKRVSDYLALHKNIESKLPKLKYTGSSVIIEGHQHALAKAIRQARANAKQGDIFTPAISAELRRRALAAMQGDKAWRVEKSLEDSEPVKFAMKINIAYPPGVPKQSMPPSLLASLPPLPPELEYRLLGGTLVLLDIRADLVVDLDPDFFP